MAETIVVTGGAGFIGSALIAQLNEAGYQRILVVDHLGTTDKWKNLVGKRFLDYLHKDDFRRLIQEERLAGEIKTIIHLGACSSTIERDGDYLLSNNYGYSRELAEFCLHHDIRFVYASSAATYGDGSAGYADDEKSIDALRPLNLYGYSKQLFDQWAVDSGAIQSMAGLKFFNVYGPNEYHKGFMTSGVLKSFDQAAGAGKISLFRSHRPEYPDGEQKRDFVYVKDCTAVLLWLMEEGSVNGLFNLGTGRARSWNDLAKAVFAALKSSPRIEFIDTPPDIRNQYQYFTEAPMGKLNAAGFARPFHSLEAGVHDYVVNYLSKGRAVL